MVNQYVLDKLKQYCTNGKIINPLTERCIKVNGKVAKTMMAIYDGDGVMPECTIVKIRNPESGRCVKINGKVGKKIMSTYDAINIHIIFRPEIWQIGNSSFLRSRSHRSYQKWDKADGKHYLEWYRLFTNKIKNILAKNKLQFMGFSVKGNNNIHLQIRSKLMAPLVSILKDVHVTPTGILKDVLQPDTEEDHLVEIDGILYLVQADEIISVTLEPQK